MELERVKVRKKQLTDHIYEGKFSNDMKNGKGKVTYKTLNDFL